MLSTCQEWYVTLGVMLIYVKLLGTMQMHVYDAKHLAWTIDPK